MFGAVLDMVTDRVTTAGLILHLTGKCFPRWQFYGMLLNGLDLSAHYMQMYASLSCGATSHKTTSPEVNGHLLHLYYSNRKVLFFVCAANEAFYMLLYVWLYFLNDKQFDGWTIWTFYALLIASTVLWLFKQYTNVLQLIQSSKLLAQLDTKST